MLSVLKSWLLGTPGPLHLSSMPAGAGVVLAEQQNDEVSIAFIQADVNVSSRDGHALGPGASAVVAIYRGWQSREEYLREWRMAQLADGRIAVALATDRGRSASGARAMLCCGERLVQTAAHDRRDGLRTGGRRNRPSLPMLPSRRRSLPWFNAMDMTDGDRPAALGHAPAPRSGGAEDGIEARARIGAIPPTPAMRFAAAMPPSASQRCMPRQFAPISRWLTDLGEDHSLQDASQVGMPSVRSLAALAGVEPLGLSRSIQDMGRGW